MNKERKQEIAVKAERSLPNVTAIYAAICTDLELPTKSTSAVLRIKLQELYDADWYLDPESLRQVGHFIVDHKIKDGLANAVAHSIVDGVDDNQSLCERHDTKYHTIAACKANIKSEFYEDERGQRRASFWRSIIDTAFNFDPVKYRSETRPPLDRDLVEWVKFRAKQKGFGSSRVEIFIAYLSGKESAKIAYERKVSRANVDRSIRKSRRKFGLPIKSYAKLAWRKVVMGDRDILMQNMQKHKTQFGFLDNAENRRRFKDWVIYEFGRRKLKQTHADWFIDRFVDGKSNREIAQAAGKKSLSHAKLSIKNYRLVIRQAFASNGLPAKNIDDVMVQLADRFQVSQKSGFRDIDFLSFVASRVCLRSNGWNEMGDTALQILLPMLQDGLRFTEIAQKHGLKSQAASSNRLARFAGNYISHDSNGILIENVQIMLNMMAIEWRGFCQSLGIDNSNEPRLVIKSEEPNTPHQFHPPGELKPGGRWQWASGFKHCGRGR
jgi:DNA-binding CsgD family transcriptional regulator